MPQYNRNQDINNEDVDIFELAKMKGIKVS